MLDEFVNQGKEGRQFEGFVETDSLAFFKSMSWHSWPCGHQDGGNICQFWFGTKLIIDFDASHLRKLIVENNQVRFEIMDGLERLKAITHQNRMIEGLLP